MTSTILVLRALGLGDLLTSVPALRGLRTAYPDEHLVLAAPEPLRPLVELIDAVDELLPTPALGTLQWSGAAPAMAVNLHGRGPQSIRDLAAVTPARLLTHRHPDFPEFDGPDWSSEPHEVQRWCRLLAYSGIEADPRALALPPPGAHAAESKVIVIHPGAASAARRWPATYFAKVARRLSADGHRVVVTGSPEEIPLATAVARDAQLPHSSIYAGRTDLAELAAIVAEATLVVCGDTGVGHLATAFGTPSVLLFGPTPPRLWGPPSDARGHITLWAGEVGDPHAERPHPGLLALTPEHVLSAAAELVGQEARHG